MSTADEPRPLTTQLVVLAALTVVVLGSLVMAVTAVAGVPATATSSRAAADADCSPAAAPVEPRFLGAPVELVPVATADEPTWLALDPHRPGSGVLTERPGRVRMVLGSRVTDEVVIDLRTDTADDGDGGLLVAAYDPSGAWLYLFRSTPEGDDVLTAHRLADDGRPAARGREVLHVPRPPSKQHHGGAMAFGTDGLLYLGLGDGGGIGDPRENAQDSSSLLGKVLRIRPTPGGARPYSVPDDNPFTGRYGWRPEIWALGVRNPFRLSVDPATGALWLGDVGQSCWEEINRLADADAGANLGWDRLEGDADFEGGTVTGRYLSPVVVHGHPEGWCAIVTGYVPRQAPVTPLDGRLLYADYCAGRLLALDVDAAPDDPDRVTSVGPKVEGPVAIVPGPAGAPWVLTLDGTILELRAATPGA